MQDLLSWWNAAPRADILWSVVRGLIFLVLGWQLARLARHSFERSVARTAADASLSILLGRIIYLVVAGLGALTALDVLGVPLSSVVATLGIVGIAISLAMQDILKSFFAGLYLLFERPFRIGDEIQLKDFIGRVEHINYRTTVILTTDGVRVLIPNATLMSEVVLNRGVAGASERSGPKV
ncbi:MAG TPA: mechanosensitive ion channel domain-containing protein [Chloroflexota bacterium]|jgi:small conductance mechanosensitive channel|nr:mechanosensitive ion channel domain-containing protein [Chloroflexota bacterium]